MNAAAQPHLGIGQQTVNTRVTLNELVNASTQSFLKQSGLKPGMNVLDLSCGIGTMSCWLAEQVGPEGMVIAIDTNEKNLGFGRQLAERAHCQNIEFINLSIHELEKIQTRFDLIYSRFLLVHLDNPKEAIEAIHHHLEPGGIFACESIILGNEFCYPESKAFDRWRELNFETFKAFEKDPQTGMKLHSMMNEVGFHDIHSKIYQPVLDNETQRQDMLLNDLNDQAATFIEFGLSDPAEIVQLQEGLAELVKSESHMVAYCQSCQVAGVK